MIIEAEIRQVQVFQEGENSFAKVGIETTNPLESFEIRLNKQSIDQGLLETFQRNLHKKVSMPLSVSIYKTYLQHQLPFGTLKSSIQPITTTVETSSVSDLKPAKNG